MKQCSHFNKRGEACRARVVHGTDPPACDYHRRSAASRDAFKRQGTQARAHAGRERAEARKSRPQISPGVSLAHVAQVIDEALDATYEYTGEIDHQVRLNACLVVLNVFPRQLRDTPETMTALLRSVFEGTRHARLAEQDTSDVYTAGRAGWWEGNLRCTRIGSLYINPLPDFLLAPGESRAKVMKEEAPDLTGWRVEELKDEYREKIDTHVLAIAPDGSRQLIPRDAWGT